MKKTFAVIAAAFAVAFVVVACSGSGPTSPDPVVQAPAPQTPVAAPAATEAPTVDPSPEPEQSGGSQPVSYQGTNCSGTLSNPNPAARWVDVHYTPPGVPAGEDDYLVKRFNVPGKGQKNVPSAQSVFESNYPLPKPSCEPWKLAIPVQCDFVTGVANDGAHHIGGQGANISLSVPALPVEPIGEPHTEFDYGEWVRGDGCYETRTWTSLTTQRMQCADPEISRDKGVERRDGEWIVGSEFTITGLSRLGYYKVVVDGVKVFEGWGGDYGLNPIVNAGSVKVYQRFLGWHLKASKTSAECGPQFSESCGGKCGPKITLKCIRYCSLDQVD